MPYQKQTGNTYFQNRVAVDKSKQLYEEHKSKSSADESFIRNYERTTAEFKDGLEQWSAIHERRDQETIDFWNEVNPVISQMLGKDGAVWKGLEMKQNQDREKSLQSWRELSVEDKTNHKWVLGQLLAKQKDLELKKGTLSDIARRQYQATGDDRYTRYAEFLDGNTKVGNTAIYLKLMQEKLQNYPEQLRSAFSGTEKIYTDLDGIKFSGQEIYAIPGKSAERISIINETVASESYFQMDVGGLNNKTIFAAVDDKIQASNEASIARLATARRLELADEGAKNLSLEIETTLSLFTDVSTATGDINWLFDEEGKVNPAVIANIKGARDQFKKHGIDKGVTNPNEYADIEFSKALMKWKASLPESHQEAAQDFLLEVMGYGNLDTNNTLKFDHSDGSGKQVTLAYISNAYYGSEQRWMGTGGSVDGTSGSNLLGTNTTPTSLISKNDTVLEEVKFRPSAAKIQQEKMGNLYLDNGELNPKWQGYAEYELELLRNGGATSQAQLEARAAEILKDLQNRGVRDLALMNKLMHISMRKTRPDTLHELKNKKGIDQYIVGKGEFRQILLSDLHKYDQATVKEILAEDAYKDVKIVESIYGSSDRENLQDSMNQVRSAVAATLKANNSDETIGSVAIEQNINAWIMQTALSGNLNVPEATRINNATIAALEIFSKARLDVDHDWHIDKNGRAKNEFDRSWIGNIGNFFTGNRDREERKFAQIQLDSRLKKSLNNANVDTNTALSKQVLLLDDNLLNVLVGRDLKQLDQNKNLIITDNQIALPLRLFATKNGEWPIDVVNNQLQLLNEKDGGNRPLKTESLIMKQIRKIMSPKDYHAILSLSKDDDYRIGGHIRYPWGTINQKATRTINKMLMRIDVGDKTPPPQELNVVQSFASVFNNSYDTVDSSRNPDNPNIGTYNLLESDVKEYYKNNKLGTYSRDNFLNPENKDLQLKVMNSLVSKLSGEVQSKAANNPQMLRMLFNKLFTGEYIHDTGARAVDSTIHEYRTYKTIQDPIHVKGTLFLNNYRLYGVNK